MSPRPLEGTRPTGGGLGARAGRAQSLSSTPTAAFPKSQLSRRGAWPWRVGFLPSLATFVKSGDGDEEYVRDFSCVLVSCQQSY